MTQQMPELSIAVRPARPEDVGRMLEIFLERKFDSLPVDPDHEKGRIRHYSRYGEGVNMFNNDIALAREDSDHYFSRVAVVGDTVGGFATAAAKPGESHQWWNNLTVTRELEGKGVGQSLGVAWRKWARDIGKSALVRIGTTNQRSMDFFTRQHFTPLRIEWVAYRMTGDECHLRPYGIPHYMAFQIMELGKASLMGVSQDP